MNLVLNPYLARILILLVLLSYVLDITKLRSFFLYCFCLFMEFELFNQLLKDLDFKSGNCDSLFIDPLKIDFICDLFEELNISECVSRNVPVGAYHTCLAADSDVSGSFSLFTSGLRTDVDGYFFQDFCEENSGESLSSGEIQAKNKESSISSGDCFPATGYNSSNDPGLGQVIMVDRIQSLDLDGNLYELAEGVEAHLWSFVYKLTKASPFVNEPSYVIKRLRKLKTRASCNALLTINFLDLLLVSHQVKLDFYLFSHDKIGMISLSFMEDVGKSFIYTEDYCSWNYLKDHFDNVLPLYLVYQFKHLDPYTSVQITLLLDIPQRQTFKPGFTGNGAWAVSTYTWYKSGLYCVDGLKGIGWMFEGFSVCSWQVFDISFTKFFFSDLLDPFSNLVVYWVVSCLLVECILTSRPRSPSSSMKAWEVFLYTRKCVCEWILSAIGKLIKILMFGGSWCSLVSHPSSSRGSDALIVCEALCRKHIHVLKGSLMVVPVPHDRSGSDEGRAVSYVSSLVLDRLLNNFMSSWWHSLARHLIRLYYYYLNYCNFYFLGLGCYFVLVRPPVWCLPTVMA